MQLSKIFLILIFGSLPFSGCGPNYFSSSDESAEQPQTKTKVNTQDHTVAIEKESILENDDDDDGITPIVPIIIDPQDIGIPPRPIEKQTKCEIMSGVPEEGLGHYDKLSDTYNFNLTFRKDYLDCDHKGPNSQFCVLQKGGYVTWLENGQNRYIKANDGKLNIILKYKIGVRCYEKN